MEKKALGTRHGALSPKQLSGIAIASRLSYTIFDARFDAVQPVAPGSPSVTPVPLRIGADAKRERSQREGNSPEGAGGGGEGGGGAGGCCAALQASPLGGGVGGLRVAVGATGDTGVAREVHQMGLRGVARRRGVGVRGLGL